MKKIHSTCRTLLLVALLAALSSFHPAPPTGTITIHRMFKGDQCVMGYFSINGNTVQGYSLELPWQYNINEISCIPEGRYSGWIRTDGSKGWRVELSNVPGRSNVQLHIGNYLSDIKGCILVGTTASVDDCSVYGSADALASLRKELEISFLLTEDNLSHSLAFIVK